MKKKDMILPVPEELMYQDNGFRLRIGGTTFEVGTHFDPGGRRSVLDQFWELLPDLHIGQQCTEDRTMDVPLQCPVVRKGDIGT